MVVQLRESFRAHSVALYNNRPWGEGGRRSRMTGSKTALKEVPWGKTLWPNMYTTPTSSHIPQNTMLSALSCTSEMLSLLFQIDYWAKNTINFTEQLCQLHESPPIFNWWIDEQTQAGNKLDVHSKRTRHLLWQHNQNNLDAAEKAMTEFRLRLINTFFRYCHYLNR